MWINEHIDLKFIVGVDVLMLSNILVEYLNDGDIHKYSKLAKTTIIELPHYPEFSKKCLLHDFSIKQVKIDIRDKNVVCIVAKKNDAVVGFIRGFFDGGVSGGIFWLQWVGTDKAYRRTGVAEAMMKYLENQLRTLKIHKIVCVVRPKNKASISFFEKNKFEYITALKNHWFKKDFCLWQKVL